MLSSWKNQIYSSGSWTSQTELLLGLEMLWLFSFMSSIYYIIWGNYWILLWLYLLQLCSDPLLWQKSCQTEAPVVSLSQIHRCLPLKQCPCLADVTPLEPRRKCCPFRHLQRSWVQSVLLQPLLPSTRFPSHTVTVWHCPSDLPERWALGTFLDGFLAVQ